MLQLESIAKLHPELSDVATVEKVVTEDQASKGTACTVRICIQLADQVQQVVAGGAEGQDQGGQDGG